MAGGCCLKVLTRVEPFKFVGAVTASDVGKVTMIARFIVGSAGSFIHNVYGPFGAYDGGREKEPFFPGYNARQAAFGWHRMEKCLRALKRYFREVEIAELSQPTRRALICRK